ncbi:putative manganese superoxide dismutase [Fragilariopsis cylindrus CCMP1102]|uniref:Superoxide dismutase n=1 Tax=Fragilariopsis cylindrus CCMP1102 TaxID=635003 RepID=A0A1E7FFE8_9STRA|nr:putative manganese superoxide dismutase [Fragilariopsis cylindrus CCMP1102]|eukprot:OEU16864.1 putative manganese superoxide dismutase [Fragilariopsis cylindrus CCMP1102]
MSGGKIILDKALRSAVNLSSSKLPSEVAKSSAKLFSALSGTKFVLPDLAYDYNALEPAISAETMEIHHSKHHQTYITNLNATMEKIDSAMIAGDVSGTIALQGALKFNGGGHINHTLFWENLSPTSTFPTGGPLDKAITDRFGSLDDMIAEMSAKTLAVQGSGWGWLVYDPKNRRALLIKTVLVSMLDMHTRRYRNVDDYLKAIWDIINWDVVEERLIAASK